MHISFQWSIYIDQAQIWNATHVIEGDSVLQDHYTLYKQQITLKDLIFKTKIITKKKLSFDGVKLT